MSRRTTLVLLIANVIVLPIIWFDVSRKQFAFHQDLDQPFNFPIDTASRLEVYLPGKPGIVCERVSGGSMGPRVGDETPGSDWRITAPFEFSGASALIQDTLIYDFRETRVRLEVGGDPNAFGLDEPQVRVVVTSLQGQHELAFGDNHATEAAVYARIDGEQVILCDQELRDKFLEVTPDVLRNTALCDVHPERADRVEIRGEVAVELARDGVGWTVAAPFVSRASELVVGRLLRALNSWGIEEFVADGVDPAQNPSWGLAEPRWRVVVRDGERDRTLTLLIGAEGPPSPEGLARVYVAWERHRHVFLVLAEPVDLLRERADGYRDRDLFSASSPDITRLDVVIDPEGPERLDVSVQAQAPDAAGMVQWTMTIDGGDRFRVDSDFMMGMIQSLRAGRVSEFLPESAAKISEYGFDRPSIRIVMTDAAGNEDYLLIARGVDGGNERYVSKPTWSYLATAFLPVEEELLGVPWSFRSGRVHDVSPTALRGFSLKKPGAPPKEFLRPYDQWKVRTARGAELADEQYARTVARAISELNAVSWEPVPENPPGPDDYFLRIGIATDPNGPETSHYWVGPSLGEGMRLIREGDGPWIFLVKLQEGAPDPFLMMRKLVE